MGRTDVNQVEWDRRDRMQLWEDGGHLRSQNVSGWHISYNRGTTWDYGCKKCKATGSKNKCDGPQPLHSNWKGYANQPTWDGYGVQPDWSGYKTHEPRQVSDGKCPKDNCDGDWFRRNPLVLEWRSLPKDEVTYYTTKKVLRTDIGTGGYAGKGIEFQNYPPPTAEWRQLSPAGQSSTLTVKCYYPPEIQRRFDVEALVKERFPPGKIPDIPNYTGVDDIIMSMLPPPVTTPPQDEPQVDMDQAGVETRLLEAAFTRIADDFLTDLIELQLNPSQV